MIGIQLTLIYFLTFYRLEGKKGKEFIWPIIVLSIQYAALLLTLSRGPKFHSLLE